MIFVAFGVHAQEPVHYFINEDDGLPSNTVYDIMQDSKGYMWIATEKGLVKYDGQHFKIYRNSNQKGGNCTNLVEGGGRIWCTNFARQIFYVENDSLKELSFWNGADKKSVLDIDYNEKDSCLYVGCGLGIYKLDLADKTTELITEPDHTTKFVWRLSIKDGVVYGLNSRVHITYSDGQLHSWPNMLDGSSRYSDAVIQHKGRVLAAFVNSPFWYEFTKDGLRPTELPTGLIESNIGPSSSIRLDDSGQLWLSRKDELLIQSEIWPQNSDEFTGIKDVLASEVITDREGQYWLSTLDKGVMVIPDINIWRHPLVGEAKDIIKTKQGLWGLTAKEIKPIGHSAKSITLPGEIDGVSRAWYDEASDTWMVSAKGFYLLQRGKVVKMIDVGSVKDVMVLGDTLFCATNVGVRYLQLSRVEKNEITSVVNGRYYALAQRDGYFLAGFDNGLQLFDLMEDGSMELHIMDTVLYISDIVNADDTYTYIATEGGGLKAFNNAALLRDYFELPANTNNVHRLATQGNKLFAVFDEGVLMIDLEIKSISVIDKTDGLPTHDIKSIALYEGRVYMATSKGVVSFPLDMKGLNEIAPPIEIIQPWRSIEWQMSHGNDYEFQFFSGTYKHNGKLKYKYRLLGSSDEWTETDANTASFVNMPAGEYTLEVVAVNEDGIESETPATYSFTIVPPWWQTWWFNLLMVASLVGVTLVVALLIAQYRRRKKDRENQAKLEQSRMKEEMTAYQLKALRAQMNPHFIFNALNTLQRYIMTNDKSEAGEYLGRFSDLMRKFLSMSENQNAKLEDEIEMLRLYLDIEKERMKDDFTYQLNISEDIDTEQVKIPTMLVQPIAENAIKHGLLHKKGEKHLKLDFALISNQLQITIEDNGVGRERSKEINSKREGHQSFGLKAVQSRIDLINQSGAQKAELRIEDLKGDDGKGVGTRVILMFA